MGRLRSWFSEENWSESLKYLSKAGLKGDIVMGTAWLGLFFFFGHHLGLFILVRKHKNGPEETGSGRAGWEVNSHRQKVSLHLPVGAYYLVLEMCNFICCHLICRNMIVKYE